MQFDLKVLHGKTNVSVIAIEAPDIPAALDQAMAQGYAVIGIKARRGQSSARHGGPFPLQLFTQELLSLLQAGLSLVESLETLAEKEASPAIRRTLDSLVAQLYEGQALSSAMQSFPTIFPPLYVATVRTSERTGDIPAALGRYIAYQSQLDVVRKKVINASIYPALLLAVGSLVVFFLLGYVVPKFAGVYEGSERELPLLSKWLLEWGTLIGENGWLAAGVVAVVIAAALHLVTRPASGAWLLARLRGIPAIGARLRIFQLARLYRTVGMLLKGGVPASSALSMAEPLLEPGLRLQLQRALQDIREGQSISTAFESSHLTTPVSQRMLRVGERAGNMGEMMERIAAFYDEEIARWVDWFTRLFEPLLMAFIGLVIGVIVVLMYLPIFEVAGSLQ